MIYVYIYIDISSSSLKTEHELRARLIFHLIYWYMHVCIEVGLQ